MCMSKIVMLLFIIFYSANNSGHYINATNAGLIIPVDKSDLGYNPVSHNSSQLKVYITNTHKKDIGILLFARGYSDLGMNIIQLYCHCLIFPLILEPKKMCKLAN